MADIRNLQELLRKTVLSVQESNEVYKGFLQTAAWNYKYSLTDQFFIFAQKPNAIAVADRDLWEKRLNRQVKRTAMAILHLDSQGTTASLFDVSDTIDGFRKGNPFRLWEYIPEKDSEFWHALKDSYDVSGDLSAEAIINEIVYGVVFDIVSDVYNNAVSLLAEKDIFEPTDFTPSDLNDWLFNSVLYMVSERMGLGLEPSFDAVSKFQDTDVFLYGLSAISETAEQLLRDIDKKVKQYIPQQQVNKIYKEDYYGQHKLQTDRELFSTGLSGREDDAPEEIREAENDLSAGGEAGSLHQNADDGRIEGTPSLDSGRSGKESGEVDRAAAREESGAEERREHAGMGRSYEQSEDAGRRDDVSGDSVSLKKTVSLPQNEIDFILKSESFFKVDKEELASLFLNREASFDEKLNALKERFNEDYSTLLTGDDKCPVLGYKKNPPKAYLDGVWTYQDGVEFWEGNGYPDERMFLSWEEVYSRVNELIENEVFLDVPSLSDNIIVKPVTEEAVLKEFLEGEREVSEVVESSSSVSLNADVDIDEDEMRLFEASFSLKERRVSEDMVSYLLLYEHPNFKYSKEEMDTFLSDETLSDAQKKEYLISNYGNVHYGVPHISNEQGMLAGIAGWTDGLYLSEGNENEVTADSLVSWDDVLAYRLNLLQAEKGGITVQTANTNVDVEEKNIPDYVIDETGKVSIREEVLETELFRGSGISHGKMRIYSYFTEGEHSNAEFASFLKDEYGTGGHSAIGLVSYSGVDHDPKGLHFKNYSDSARDVTVGWNKVASTINKMIQEDKYLSENEKAYLPIYANEMEGRRLIRELQDVLKETNPELGNSGIHRILFNSDNDGYSYMYPYDSILEVVFHPLLKNELITRLTNYVEFDLSGEEQEKLLAFIEKIREFTSLQPAKEPYWSKTDWNLYHNATVSGLSELVLHEDDIVLIAGSRHQVIDVMDDGYLIQEVDFPIFTRKMSTEELTTVLRESKFNDEFFKETGQKEPGGSFPNRVFRLFSQGAKEVFEGKMRSFIYEKENSTPIYVFFDKETGIGGFGRVSKNTGELIENCSFVIDEEKENLTFISYESSDIAFGIDKEITTAEQGYLNVLAYSYFSDILTKDYTSRETEILFLPDNITLENSELSREEKGVLEALEESKALKEDEKRLEEVQDVLERKSEEFEESPADEVTQAVEAVPVNDNPIHFDLSKEEFVFGGPKERFRGNIEAIRLLKVLEAEKRFATEEEQKVLSRYVGWGGLSDAFDSSKNNWASEYEELLGVLTEDEYRAARESTLTAFYTPPEVISAIYDALSNMGFSEGNLLEPSCGTGNFFGMVPEKLRGCGLYGVELDDISGRIAKQLYQDANIQITGFEKSDLPDQFFDVAIGNVPFGQFSVDDPKYRNQSFLIHDYFFAKALDKVRPGGVVAFITSKGTMDKESTEFREYLASRADLLGAIRLPNNTFTKNAGTKVTSDILFFQKRDRLTNDTPDWVYTEEYINRQSMNSYFVNHPEMILGEIKEESTQFGRMDLTCAPTETPLEDLLADAISHVEGEIVPSDFEEILEERKEDRSVIADPSIENFGYTLVNDEVYQRQHSRMYPVETNQMALKRIRGMIGLRDLTRALIQAQMQDASDDAVLALQKELNASYDAFVKEYGRINSVGNHNAFSDDSSYFLLCSLEIFDNEGEFIRKADIFTKRTIQKNIPITHASTAVEALGVSIGEKAGVDLDFMQELMDEGTTKESIIEDLTGVIFQDPEISTEPYEGYVTADEYLSGKVKRKLAYAKEEAQNNPAFLVNVEALEQVQPKDLDATEISVRLGSTWLPADIIRDFVHEMFDIPDWAKDPERSYNYVDVIYEPYLDKWTITNVNYLDNLTTARSTYGTARRGGFQILDDCLNLKQSQVIDYYEVDGKRVSEVNRHETMVAQQKQEFLKDEFISWLWKDMDRRERVVRIYNDKFNNIRPREYDGKHIIFHGMNPEITLFDHQRDAIARALYGGNALFAHAVGAGKTWEMAATAMESKHLGLCTKSMFVVPNHLIAQWASEFLQLYPSANILVATKKDFETQNRKKFCSRIATGNYDAVIIGHSQFGLLPLSKERQERMIQRELDEIERQIIEAKNSEGKHATIKQLERARKSQQANLEKLNNAERKDNVIAFEELGIDRLFVDEFHFYKNLWLYTKMQNISGISQTGAQKSQDLYMKCQYMDELTGNRGVIGATGTPITNSMTELYTMQRYFASEKLEEAGLSSFDSWASTFGETVTAVELAPEGTNYRAKTKFAKFYNLPELISMYKEFADVKTADMLDLDVPDAEYVTIAVDASPEQKDLLDSLVQRAEKVRNGSVDPTEDNMLKITNDGRKLALDQRLLDDTLPDNPNSKVNACVDNVYRIFEETKEDRLTQLVFCDLSTPTAKGRKKGEGENKEETELSFENVYEDIKRKLIEKGVPESEIAFIHDATTEKQKDKLFGKVRSGKVRILLGSTFKMGAGTNVQDRIIASHDLDCPWRPADLEQRSGRTIRQGNENDKVKIYRYVTKDTFDAYLWQLVENKQRFISQIQTSKSPVRVAEDIDEKALDYAEIKALAAGNPLIKEKMDLDLEVRKLNALKANFLRDRFRLEDNVAKGYPEKISRLKAMINGVTADFEFYNENKKKAFEIVLQGKVYTDKKEAGEALVKILENNKELLTTKIGEMNGFSISIKPGFLKEHKIIISNKYEYSFYAYKSGHGNLGGIEKVFASFGEHIEKANQDLATTEKQLEQAKKELQKEFQYTEELETKNRRLAELNIILNVDAGAGPEELLKSAKDENTAPELLLKMAENEDVSIREAIAANPATPLDGILYLKDDSVSAVQKAALCNPNMPDEVVEEYCMKVSEDLLMELLDSPKISSKTLLLVESTFDAESTSNVLYKLARHKQATPELNDKLIKREKKHLCTTVLESAKELLPESFESAFELLKNDDWSLRSLARREDLPECYMEKIVDMNATWTMEEMINNKRVPIHLVQKMYNCGGWTVRQKAKQILEEYKDKNVNPNSLDGMIRSADLERNGTTKSSGKEKEMHRD